MPRPFEDNLKRYKAMMDDLQARRQPAMSPEVQDAIIQAESSGRPDVVGDVGARAGSSRGLMQIQDQTARDLLKQGKLPSTWNGKKVKKRDLPELLLDPEFNKQAGSALYADNRKILARKAKQKNIELSDDQLENLTIKSHNQGVTRTIKRDLLGEEPLNPKVQQYLQKIKPQFQDGGIPDSGRSRDVDPEVLAQMATNSEIGTPITPEEFVQIQEANQSQVALPEPEGDEFSYLQRQIMEDQLRQQEMLAGQPQEFDDGGTVQPNFFDTEEEYAQRIANQEADQFSMGDLSQPLPEEQSLPDIAQESLPQEPVAPSPSDPYKDLMAEYEASKQKYEEDKQQAKYADLATGVTNAFAQYGVDRSAAQAQIAGGAPIRSKDLGLKALGATKGLKSPKLAEYVQKANLMKTLKELKADGKPMSEYQKQTLLSKKDASKYKKEQDKLDNKYREKVFADKIKARASKSTGTGSSDPKSQASIIARQEAQFLTGKPFPESFSEAKINKIVTSLARKLESGYQSKRFEQSKERLGLGKERLGFSKEKEEQRESEKVQSIALKADDNIYGVTKDFEGNAVKKEMDKQGISFDQANSLIQQIESGNELALGALGTKMARAMGEVGVLTNEDVIRYTQSQSIVRKGKDYYTRLGKGKLYKETLKDMKAVVKKMSAGFKVKEKEIYDRYTKRAYENYGKQAGISRKEIYKRFGMNYRIKLKAPSEAQVNKYIKLNPTLNREQAERILTNRLNK